MSKVISIKLIRSGKDIGPFTIKDEYGDILATGVSKDSLIAGMSFTVNDNVDIITLVGEGDCAAQKSKAIGIITQKDYLSTEYVLTQTSCLWRHLTDVSLFNSYYGVTNPYIIEYPISTAPYTEILQDVKSYDKVFKYFPPETGVFSYTDRILVDNVWFDNAIIYSHQQCTGLLELVPKPKNNLQAYNKYPIYKESSRVITYTKSDDYYNINGFWDVVKDKTVPIAITSCESLSYDGILNQANMNYTYNSFKKSQIRAKDLKIRLSLTSKSNVHIVSQFLLTSNQISYK